MVRDTGNVGQAGLLAGVEQAADGIVITNTNGEIQYVNPAFTALTGYSSAEAVGQKPGILKSGHQSQAFYEELWSTIRSGEVWHGELINRRKDGTFYCEEMQISPVRDPNSEISGYIAIKRDVTARRATEEAHGFLAAIVESSGDAIIAFTPAGIILTWNRGAETMFGYAAEEVIGTPYSVIVLPERLPALTHFIEQIMLGHPVPQYEAICLRRDGRRIDVFVAGSPVRNSSGAVVAVSVIIRDISDRKRAEVALHDSEERFRIMADGCPSVMWVTDADGRNQFINRAYRELLAVTYEQMEGHKWQLALHPDDAPAYIYAFQRAVREQIAFRAETRVLRADGEWRWLASYAEPRLSADGKFLGHVGISPDITERKRGEDALRYQYRLTRAILDASPDGVLLVNDKGLIASHNRKFLDVWQIPLSDIPENLPDEAILAAAIDRVKDPEAFLKRIQELNDDPEVDDHREIELRDGRTIERYTTSLGRPDDRQQGRVWFFRDVTERREAAQRLRNSEENFRQLAENIREVFWMRDIAAAKVLYVSPAYEQIWGQKRESLYANSDNWTASIHPEDLPEAIKRAGRLATGEAIENEYRIVQPSGDIRWIRDRAFPVRDQGGNIVRLAGVAEDATERKVSELRLLHQGLHDDLTGLPNRRLFRENLGKAIAGYCPRDYGTARTGAVFFIDLDQFKLVNDTLGHSAGDDLLLEVANRWLGLEGIAGNLARFGGDEFNLFVTGFDGADSVRDFGEKLLGCLDEPFHVAGQDVFLGASVGVSLFPQDGTDAGVLMRAADVALHEAKRDGKNQVRFFASGLAGAARARLEMETRLRKAVAQSEFKLQFQPQFASGQSRPSRFEALIRWYPPDASPVSPLQFIPIAEQNGLIVPIGTWVLQEACRQCAAWQTGELRGVGVAVNVSAIQFACPGFLAVIIQALESAGLRPGLLELELTESVFIKDVNAPVRTLKNLREMGVTIALDDFGTGYSSLSYLQNLPLDALKIDRSFLAQTEGRPQGVAVLRCVIDLAHAHGLRVIAEGVETPAQQSLLDGLGCDEIQGFLFGRPSFDVAGCRRGIHDAGPGVPDPAGYPWSVFAEAEPVTAFLDAVGQDAR